MKIFLKKFTILKLYVRNQFENCNRLPDIIPDFLKKALVCQLILKRKGINDVGMHMVFYNGVFCGALLIKFLLKIGFYIRGGA